MREVLLILILWVPKKLELSCKVENFNWLTSDYVWYKLEIQSNKLFKIEGRPIFSSLRRDAVKEFEKISLKDDNETLTPLTLIDNLPVTKDLRITMFELYLQKAEFLSKKYPSIITKVPNCITAPIIEEKIKP